MSINIIAQGGAVVNVNVQADSAAHDKTTEKWYTHKLESQRVARKMYYIDKERAQRMSNCADILVYNLCPDCGAWEIKKANLCRDRFCPTCNWRLSLQRYAKMTQIMQVLAEQYPSTNYSFVTLTVKNCTAENLSSVMSAMAKSWNAMLHKKEYRDGAIAGYARSVEVTYNKITKEFHPHYHVIVAWGEDDFSGRLVSNWLSYAADQGLDANIKAQCSESITTKDEGESMAGAICETFKYAVKSKQLDDMPLAQFRQLVKEIGGKRLVSFGGIFKKIAKEIGAEMEKVEDEDTKLCRHCGNTQLDKVVYKWSFGDQRYRML